MGTEVVRMAGQGETIGFSIQAWFDLVGLFGWLVIAAALRVVVPAGRRLALGIVSRGWSTTAGRVVHSEIATAMSGTSDRSRLLYLPETGYEYEVRGRGYSASAVAARRPGFSHREDCEDLLVSYPQGASTVVHHHPARPERALLMHGWHLVDAVEVLAGLAFGAVGLAIARIGDPVRGLERILAWFRVSLA